ncbi:hypothetical protein [Derxia gummosa]|uniref:Uncharacterized protein n=1 Tax=Derxia gummosa DSM 723 TaxID=1121388 RepID=A0A8B6X2Z4_9BURK|nr:hypothetical protein [Derxia gummosa]
MFDRLRLHAVCSACLGALFRAPGSTRHGLMAMVRILVVALAVFTVEHPALAEDFEEEVEAELSLAKVAFGESHESTASPAPGASPAVPQAPGELPDMGLPLPVAAQLPALIDIAPPASSPSLAEPFIRPLLRPPIV